MRAKIIKAFLTIVALLLISEAFFVFIHFTIADKYQQMTDDLVSEYQLSKNTTELINSFYDLIQYSNDQQRLATFKDSLTGLQVLLAKLDKNLAGNDSWTVYLGTKNTINVVIDDVNKGNENIAAGNFADVTADYLKAANDNNYVRENTGSLLLKELENVEKTQAQAVTIKFWSELIGIILFIAVALGCLLYVFSFSKKLIEDMDKKEEKSTTPTQITKILPDKKL